MKPYQGNLPPGLAFESGDAAMWPKSPGFREAGGTPQGDNAAGGVSACDSSGKITAARTPNALPAPAPETIAIAITDVPAVRMPPDANYDARFKSAESSLISVLNPGLQFGERPADSIPSGP